MTRDEMNAPFRLSPEVRHALVVGALALLLSSLPYVVGYTAQMPDRVFDGAVAVLPDYHSHLAKMQQGLRGEWLYRLMHTSEDHPGALLQTFYVALGHVARLTRLPLPLMYHVARVAFGALFFVAVYRFVAAFKPLPAIRRAAFTLVAFSSGLGWLMLIVAPAGPGGISPIDFWLVDANSFFGLLMFPHFNVVAALLLTIYTRLIGRFDLQPSSFTLRYALTTALLAFLLTAIHPYAIATFVGPTIAFGILKLIRRQRLPADGWRLTAAAMLGAAPAFVYSAIIFLTEPAFKLWGVQLFLPSPPPIYYVTGFGLVLALALVGAGRFVREQGDRAVLTLLWIAVVSVMVYLPVGVQRRFIEGLHVPLCLVAAYGLLALVERLSTRARFVIVNFALAIASMSNVYMVIGYTAAAAARSDRLFHPADLIAAINWLGANSAWTDTVLAAESTGSLIPARIGHRVVLGHAIETLHYADRQRDVVSFFDAYTPDADRIALLSRLGVRYVVYGEDARALGSFDPASVDYLREVYASGAVTVYSVAMTHRGTLPRLETSLPA